MQLPPEMRTDGHQQIISKLQMLSLIELKRPSNSEEDGWRKTSLPTGVLVFINGIPAT
ncbi:MAG: hypothetical protein WBZ36_13110 [Candidatus Nitrosopolaris sp.]